MVNIFLILVIMIMFVMLLGANFYILVYFQSPEDKNTAYFPKIIVVLGLTMASMNVFFLPIDVSNRNTDGGLPMAILWVTIYMVIAVLAIVVIPFAIFYYESADPDESHGTQMMEAIKFEALTLIVFIIITVLLYLFLGLAEIPVKRLEAGLLPLSAVNECPSCKSKGIVIKYRISFALYIVSMLAFIGWFLLVLFGGIGLIALPMDLFNDYRLRPIPITLDEYARRKVEIGDRSTKLLEIGRNWQKSTMTKKSKSRKDRKRYNQFKQSVYLLEEDWRKLQLSYKYRKAMMPVILLWAKLAMSFIGGALTLLWTIHIILYVVPPASGAKPIHPFLNDMFIALDNAWPFFGVVAYGSFALWMQWCVIKGNFKFGLRIFIFFPIHPMRIGETLMNAFLFNTLLILLSSVAVVHLSAVAFGLYARFTGIDFIFNTSIQNLMGIKYFWSFYIYALLVIEGLTLIYLTFFPKERTLDMDKK